MTFSYIGPVTSTGTVIGQRSAVLPPGPRQGANKAEKANTKSLLKSSNITFLSIYYLIYSVFTCKCASIIFI